MQKLGQHFLKNKSVLERIVQSLESKFGETILEIGPGHGELTQEIFSACPGIKIVAIEKDESLVPGLKEKFSENNFEVITGDALRLLPEITRNIGGYKLAGNIPYYISGYLFRTLGELKNMPALSILMVQKEVGERLCSTPPNMNRLAASVQIWAEAKYLFSVPKGDFLPPPKVDSGVIRLLTKKTNIDKEKYFEAVKILFKQPRKTILNNISEKLSKEDSKNILQDLNISPELRPENLSLPQIESISQKL